MAVITGQTDDDILIGTAENDTLDGTVSSGIALYNGYSYEYTFDRYRDRTVVTSFGTGEGIDTLLNLKLIKFKDKFVKIKEPLLLDSAEVVQESALLNNSYQTAQLISSPSYINGSIFSSADRDFYRINLSSPGDIEISLEDQGSANLSVRLWNDFNTNGKVDSGEFHTNYKSGAFEYLYRSDRWAGDWYAEVWRSGGALTADYKLGIATKSSIGSSPSTAKNLGLLNINTAVFNSSGTVGQFDPEDWYKVTVGEKGKVTFQLNAKDGYGQPVVELYKNNNGVGERVAIADSPSVVNEKLEKVIDPGDYYVKVYDYQGYDQNAYTLSFDENRSEFYGMHWSNRTNPVYKGKTTGNINYASNFNPLGLADNFYSYWSGELYVPVAGQYTFWSGSDDGSKFYIGNSLAINNWVDGAYKEVASPAWNLTQGFHKVSYYYYEGFGGSAARLFWNKDGVKAPIPIENLSSSHFIDGTGLKGEYYNGKSFQTKMLERVEDVNYYWAGAPDPLIGADNFSVRWTGKIHLPDPHKIAIVIDNGARLWIDNQLVIDKWIDQPETKYYSSLAYTGTHDIKLEYYEGAGGATAKLLMSRDGVDLSVPISFLSQN